MRLNQFIGEVLEQARGSVRVTGERGDSRAHGTVAASVSGLTRRVGNRTRRVFQPGIDAPGDPDIVIGG